MRGRSAALAAKQVHGRVRVKVDEPWHEDAPGAAGRHGVESGVSDPGGLGRKNIRNSTAGQDDRVVFENGVSGKDGNDPAASTSASAFMRNLMLEDSKVLGGTRPRACRSRRRAGLQPIVLGFDGGNYW